MSAPRLAYDDAATPAEMHADCLAAQAALTRPLAVAAAELSQEQPKPGIEIPRRPPAGCAIYGDAEARGELERQRAFETRQPGRVRAVSPGPMVRGSAASRSRHAGSAFAAQACGLLDHRRVAARLDQWKESPQAQEPVAFGLSIVKPCFSIESTKSICAPLR